MKRYDLKPQKRFGQNFLVDSNILRRIVESGAAEEGGQVFEVGAGLGVLTLALSQAVGVNGKVVSVECDTRLIPVLNETLSEIPQITIVEGDVMKLNLAKQFEQRFDPSKKIGVIANIPYQITSPLIASLIEQKESISTMVFLVQKEVAQRLAANAGSSDYGAFTLFCQYHAEVENLFMVPRTVFYPMPEVTSAVIRLTVRQAPPVEVASEETLFAVIRAAFGQRRKTISNALSGNPALGWDKDKASQALRTARIDPARRGETLTLAEFAKIANA